MQYGFPFVRSFIHSFQSIISVQVTPMSTISSPSGQFYVLSATSPRCCTAPGSFSTSQRVVLQIKATFPVFPNRRVETRGGPLVFISSCLVLLITGWRHVKPAAEHSSSAPSLHIHVCVRLCVSVCADALFCAVHVLMCTERHSVAINSSQMIKQ